MERRAGQASTGQALIEWCVFAVAIVVVWSASWRSASRLLDRTRSQSWGMIGARQALSRAGAISTRDQTLMLSGSGRSGRSVAVTGDARSASYVGLPQRKEGASSSDFSLCGSPFLPCSE